MNQHDMRVLYYASFLNVNDGIIKTTINISYRHNIYIWDLKISSISFWRLINDIVLSTASLITGGGFACGNPRKP